MIAATNSQHDLRRTIAQEVAHEPGEYRFAATAARSWSAHHERQHADQRADDASSTF